MLAEIGCCRRFVTQKMTRGNSRNLIFRKNQLRLGSFSRSGRTEQNKPTLHDGDYLLWRNNKITTATRTSTAMEVESQTMVLSLMVVPLL